MHSFIFSGGIDRLTPRASITSALPHFDVTERFPCFATGTKHATTNAAVVEMLKVFSASPPVPQTSTHLSTFG